MTTLAYYNIRRIARHRQHMMALYALPVLVALLRVIFAKSHALLVCAWVCPFVCAILVWTILQVKISVDKASGLETGLQSTPISNTNLIWSRILTGAVVFAGQMIIFSVIIGVFIR